MRWVGFSRVGRSIWGGGVNHRRHLDLRIKGPKADEALTDRLDSSSRVLFVLGCHHEERLAVWTAWGGGWRGRRLEAGVGGSVEVWRTGKTEVIIE